MDFPSDTEDKILKYMREPGRVPFPEICAEACGVPRSYMRSWLAKGRQGDRRWAGFAREVAKIVAKYVDTLTAEIRDPDISPSLRSAKLFLLTKLEKDTFEAPPREDRKKPMVDLPPPAPGSSDDATEFLRAH